MVDIERLPQHRHCFTCGKAHTEDGRFCGDGCLDSRKAEIKKKKRQLYTIEILAIIMMVGAILLIL